MAEAEAVSAELGLSVEEMARNAFEGYMEGVRAARLADVDEVEPAPATSSEGS